MHHSFLFVLTKTKIYIPQKFSERKENTKQKVKLYIDKYVYASIYLYVYKYKHYTDIMFINMNIKKTLGGAKNKKERKYSFICIIDNIRV